MTGLLVISCVILLVPTLLASCMHWGLRRCGALETFPISWLELVIAALPGTAVAVILLVEPGADAVSPTTVAATIVALSGLTLMAWVDRVSAWAPTEIVIPVAAAIAAIGLDGAILPGIGLAAVLFLLSHLAWDLQVRANARIVSPADILALLGPLALFGLSYWSVGAFLATAALMLVALRVPPVARLFSRSEAITDAVRDTGMSDPAARGRPHVTFLSVILPVLVALYALRGALEGPVALAGATS